MIGPYPWQDQQWRVLHESRQQNRLPHGLLFTGPRGLGKNHFAQTFATALLCELPSTAGLACGACRSCQLIAAGTHPDLVHIEPVEDKKIIGVDQIRELVQFMTLKSQYAHHKVIIIDPADAMNVNAANSLLKTLEEPSADSVLILVTSRPAQLPATIRSRCQALHFGCATPEQAESWMQQHPAMRANPKLWLALADGAPLRALVLAEQGGDDQRKQWLADLTQLATRKADPIATAAKWLNMDPKNSLYWLHRWLTDVVRFKAVAEPPHVANPDVVKQLSELADPLTVAQIYRLLDRVRAGLRQLEANNNPQLVLEDILIQWLDSFATQSKVA
ncbi:MAG: DNA polymerase III subunit delta' [Gammaproteobacteria bacterium]|nr:DNA polymerase III subunit delta' [Gammaproteobacteria bacterium]